MVWLLCVRVCGDWKRLSACETGFGGWVTNNRAICMSKVYTMPQPPGLRVCMLCLVNTVVWV